MNFEIAPEDQAFRADVRAFIAAQLPADIARRGQHDYHSARDDVRRWMRILYAKGWSTPRWPARFGGTDWSPLRKYILQDELRRARAPVLDRCALDLLGPVLCTFGSPEQQARFLPHILNGDEWWNQGFSEPDSGSDLASLRTRADLEGHHYISNGQKIWTSEAHYGDWIFALVPTDQTVKPQAGISFLLIDMKSLGIVRRPIWSIDEGLIGVCAKAVGIMDAAIRMSRDYITTRRQFGGKSLHLKTMAELPQSFWTEAPSPITA